MAQAGAALGAAAGQNLAAVGGSHSLAEAMDLLAVELLGLIGTFRSHFETPPVRIASAHRRRLLDTALHPESGAVNFNRRFTQEAHWIVYLLFQKVSR